MIAKQPAQHENVTAEQRLFQRIYSRKFVSQSSLGQTEKNRILAQQFKPEKNDYDIQHGIRMGKKSKSIGSLLPQIRQIELITKSEKQYNAKPVPSSLSKLDIYLSQRHIKRSDTFNLIFMTQSTAVAPDRVMDERFGQLMGIINDVQPKNLRDLLTMSNGFQQETPEIKLEGINNKKKELEDIARQMIDQYHANEEQSDKQPQPQPSGQPKTKDPKPKQAEKVKRIDWILSECKQYDRKFRTRKNAVKGSKSNNK